MNKKELVEQIAARTKISTDQSALAVNEIIAEIAAPYVLRAPGSEVALLDNSCTNLCKEQIAQSRASR